MEIVSQPQDELLTWDEGGDDCCVLLWNLCLQSRSPTRGPCWPGPRPSSPRARYYQKDRKEIDTSIQLPTDATHPCGIATFCRRLSSIPRVSRLQGDLVISKTRCRAVALPVERPVDLHCRLRLVTPPEHQALDPLPQSDKVSCRHISGCGRDNRVAAALSDRYR